MAEALADLSLGLVGLEPGLGSRLTKLRNRAANLVDVAVDPSERPVLVAVYFDPKVVGVAKHRRLTGAGNATILSNAVRLAESGLPVRFRTPIVPGENDTRSDLIESGDFLRGLGAGPNVELELLPYHQLGRTKCNTLGRRSHLADTAPPNRQLMTGYRACLESVSQKRVIA
jgi:pyruvate-formate lyase-activating enzyme